MGFISKSIWGVAAIIMLSMAMITSCDNNPCKTIFCKNNGTCRDGACACPGGYEGPSCEYKVSDKFIGYYDGFIRYNGGKDSSATYIVTPEAGNPKRVAIYRFELLGVARIMHADVSGVNLAVPYQNADSSAFTYRGNGIIEKDKYLHLWLEETNQVGILSNLIFEGTKRTNP